MYEHVSIHMPNKMARLLADENFVRPEKIYWPRLDPFSRNTERKFIGKYRLDKATVEVLAQRYGESEYANLGSGLGGGLSHAQTVKIKKVIKTKNSPTTVL